jgi:hypothetical protein
VLDLLRHRVGGAAIGARRATTATSIDPRLIWRLGRELPYVMGLALDLAGFLPLPRRAAEPALFLVQSAVPASIAVTAVVAWIVLRTALDRLDVVAIAVILVAFSRSRCSAASDAATPVGPLFRRIALAGGAGARRDRTWAARSPSTRAHTVLAAWPPGVHRHRDRGPHGRGARPPGRHRREPSRGP